MIDFISLIFALGVGFGFSCWLFGGLLEKSNNIGDSRGTKFEYKAYPSFTVRRDKMPKSDWQCFSTMYGKNIDAGYAAPKGSEQVRRLSPEELKMYKKSNAPRGAYQSDSSHINRKDQVDEFEEWERRAGFTPDLKGIFKPIDEDPNP